MRYEDVTEAYVRAALGLPDTPRLVIEIDWDGRDFRDTWCKRTDQPAAVHVDYCYLDTDDDGDYLAPAQVAYSWDIAGQALRALLDDWATDGAGVYVTVLGWAVLFASQQQVAA